MASSAGRSFASGIQIQFGLVSIPGNLYKPIDKDKTEELKVVCPDCAEKAPQMYKCPTHGDILPGDTGRAKELDDGSLVLMSDDEIAEAKESKLPPNLFEMHIHPREEVAASLVNASGMYVFLPAEIATEHYGILHDLVENHPEFVFIGMMNLRKNDKLFRLDIGMDDQLVFQEVVWFSDIKPMPKIDHAYAPKLYGMADTLVTSLVEPFDPDEYTREARARMAAAVALASGATASGTTPAKAKPKAGNAEDMLTNALAALPKKKAAPVKKPVRKAS